MFEFTPIRAPHEAVLNIAWVKLHRMFAPLPFFMQHLFKVKFLLWASSRTKTSVSVSVYQSASQCHSYAHADHTEQYAYQPLRHGTVPLELGLWSPCMCLPLVARLVFSCHRGVHDSVAESASKCFSFALSGTRNLTIFSLFVLGLSSSFYDFTV